ncbi:MAG: PAS domain S-box protein, partial [Planctomycetota bacterium]
MESSENKGRLIDQARAARLRRRRKLNSSSDHTNDVPQTQIDALIETAETLNASEPQYRATLDAMRDAIVVIDRDLRIVLMNEKLQNWSRELGLDVSDATGQTIFDVFPFLPEKVQDEYRRVFDEGITITTEATNEIRGREIVTETRKLPIFEAGSVAKIVTIIRDITERKRTEEALRKSENRYRAVVENAGEGIVVVQDGGLQYVNPYVETVFGRTQEELAFRPFVEFIHPDDRDQVMDIHARRFKGEEVPGVYELRVVDKHGETRWLENNGILIEWLGRPATLNFLRDITDRKNAEEALRENEEKYRRVVEDQTEFIVRWLPGGIRTFVNDSYCRYFGVSPDEAVGTSCWPLISEDFHRTLGEKIESLTPENPVSTDELQVVKPDGTTAWNFWTTRALFNDQGELIEYQSVGRDITDRKRAEEDLGENQERFRHAFENANVGVCLVDMGGTITRVNGRMCEILGYEAEQLQGMSVNDVAHPDDVNISTEFIRHSISGEIENARFEKRYFHADGHVVWCQVSSSLVRNTGGEPLYFISHIQDITERRKAHDAIEDRLQFERLLSSISSRFVNLPASEIDRAVEDGLGLIGWFFEVDRVSIGQFIGSEKKPRTTHCWLADGCEPESKTQAFDTVYSNMAARLIDEGKFVYEKLEDIPETWTQERQFAATTGLKAGLIVALRVGGTVIGAIGINSLQAEPTWSDETAERLRLLGDIFANALERKRVEYALIESEAKFKSLAEQSPNMIFINKGGKVVYANKRCEEVMGYTREQLYSPDFDFLSLIA